jgi:hypothetical protein
MGGDETMTLANGWAKCLQGTEPENDFKSFETFDFYPIIKRAGGDVSKSDVEQWLGNDDGDPGYQIRNQKGMTESILQGKEEYDDFVVEESLSSCPELLVIRYHMDDAISYISVSSDPEVLAYYGHFRQFRSIISNKQHASGKRLKIDSFFQPSCTQ